ncbi:MAG: hypothetical protein HETSPECPRED_006915 [Heterodermia speciosa]|uniref:Uncharacterized protein n=1 Tax=Heterodermia speciosa TaxID=116794 RepID=A0A8H3FQ66_9LECA|nr:MAG: hypothetical protein HETSPECPRED_006915 [Heterodermia speciosa]
MTESCFYDPRFSPADTDAASPDFLKTPKQVASLVALQSPIVSRGLKRPFPGHDIETEILSHVHHLSPNPRLPLPPVEPSRQLSSSPNPSATSTNHTDNLVSTGTTTPQEPMIEKELGSSMRSASSMQTPPPTSTSTSKKKAQQAQVAKLVKESAANGKRKSTPIFPKPQNVPPNVPLTQASPPQFPNLQFSPEAFGGFSMAGPATAPVYPKNKLFWDPSQNNDGMDMDFAATDTFSDVFGIGLSKPTGSFIPGNGPMTMSQITSSSFDVDNMMGITMPPDISSATQTNYLSSAGLISGSPSKFGTTVVDPSLLFSSPSRAPEHAKLDAVPQTVQNENLRPYAHQIMDAQRERENSQSRKPKRRKGPETDSPAVKAALEVLRDEEKDRLNIQKSFRESMNAKPSYASTQVKRVSFEPSKGDTSSASRRRDGSAQRHESSRKHANRTAVELTIGPDGRAKTSTKLVARAPSRPAMDMDSDSGDTESLSSEDEARMVTSQQSSFAYPSLKLPKPKASRFDASSRAHSQKSSYASTFMSNSSENTFPRSRASQGRVVSGLGLDLDAITHSSRSVVDPALTTTFINGPLGGSQGAESETETVVDSEDDKGDAQSELKKIVKDRAQKRASAQAAASESFDNRHGYSSNRALYPTEASLTTPTQDMFNNISPTTITDPELATPSTGYESQVGSSTRCVCHSTESNGEFMIMW